MRRLFEDFDELFDLDYRIDGVPLGDLVEKMLSNLDEHPIADWGVPGPAGRVAFQPGKYVKFYYRPHLFPGMDLKLRLAHKLQFHLLPRALPAGCPLSVAAVLESYCHLSGDLFGWEELSGGGFLVWIVDLAGHGVRAGLCSSILKILIESSRERRNVAGLVGELNRTLHDCLRDRYSNVFATGFFLVLDSDRTLNYTSAGHPPILFRRSNGALEELPSLGTPMGLFPDVTYTSRKLQMGPGDALLLYTDGLVESTGMDGEPFGLDRLRGLFSASLADPESLATRVYRAVAARRDMARLEDDVTYLVAAHAAR